MLEFSSFEFRFRFQIEYGSSNLGLIYALLFSSLVLGDLYTRKDPGRGIAVTFRDANGNVRVVVNQKFVKTRPTIRP